ncbi:MAG: Fic family protein [Archaeoglobaceae archaeon]
MFQPNFAYTDKIVNNLIEITSARDTVLNAYIIPRWEVALRREALLKATHASTAIEGNPLTLEEVSLLAIGREITATQKAKQEVLNYLNVLENIDRYQKNGRVTEENILKLHKDLTRDTLEYPGYEGKYRDMQVYVGNRMTGEISFRPPPPEEVPSQMRELIEWLNSQSNELHPVIVAGVLHYELVRIHPFVDGNGRTARALATLVLYLRKFDIKQFFALDDYYDFDRRSYYKALRSVDENADLTGWLEYFTDGILISITRVRERVLQLSMERRKKDTKGQIALTERQMQILERIQQQGKITAGEVAQMFNISRQAALKELNKLVDLEVIELRGSGRGAHYVMV